MPKREFAKKPNIYQQKNHSNKGQNGFLACLKFIKPS